jgi:hypothetical protein
MFARFGTIRRQRRHRHRHWRFASGFAAAGKAQRRGKSAVAAE